MHQTRKRRRAVGVVDRWRSAHMQDPVEGSFTVAALKVRARTPGWFVEFDVDGVVVAPGVQPTPLHLGSVMVRERDALQVGQELPATVDRADPRRSVVHFPTTHESTGMSRADGGAAAEDLAHRMSDGPLPPH